MANFAIMRVEKLRTPGKILASLEHLLRERPCENADPNRKHLNENFGVSILRDGNDAPRLLDLHRKRLEGVKMMKNGVGSVQALEYVVTASPEAAKAMGDGEMRNFLIESFRFVQQKHGAQNILAATVHMDETTPHLHVILEPIVWNKDRFGRKVRELSASRTVDGSAKLSKLQTQFHKEVASNFGLKRGVEGSTAKHERVKRFYGEMGVEIERKLGISLEEIKENILKNIDEKNPQQSMAKIKEILGVEKKRTIRKKDPDIGIV